MMKNQEISKLMQIIVGIGILKHKHKSLLSVLCLEAI